MPHVPPPEHRSLLATIEAAFRRLADWGTFPPVASELVPGLPDRPMSLVELRSFLLHPATGYSTRDRVLTVMAQRARTDVDWRLALTGMLLPGLHRLAAQLGRRFSGERADLEAELVAGLQAVVMTGDLSGDRVAAQLLWAAARSGIVLLRAERRASELRTDARPVEALASPSPSSSSQHPDLLLAEAVAAGVLRRSEAEVIAATRVEKVTLRALAARWDVPYEALCKHRQRAERRLTDWLASDKAGLPGRPERARLRPHEADTEAGEDCLQRSQRSPQQPDQRRGKPTPRKDGM